MDKKYAEGRIIGAFQTPRLWGGLAVVASIGVGMFSDPTPVGWILTRGYYSHYAKFQTPRLWGGLDGLTLSRLRQISDPTPVGWIA